MLMRFAKTWLGLKTDRRGVTALEYGLIAGVIVMTIAAGFGLLANQLSSKFMGESACVAYTFASDCPP